MILSTIGLFFLAIPKWQWQSEIGRVESVDLFRGALAMSADRNAELLQYILFVAWTPGVDLVTIHWTSDLFKNHQTAIVPVGELKKMGRLPGKIDGCKIDLNLEIYDVEPHDTFRVALNKQRTRQRIPTIPAEAIIVPSGSFSWNWENQCYAGAITLDLSNATEVLTKIQEGA